MSTAWDVTVIGWGMTVVGWLLSPIIGLLLPKILSYLGFDASQKLRELEIHTIPELKRTLREVEEQRMLRGAKGDASDRSTIDKLAGMLKHAHYEAEDILDLVAYHQMEKKHVAGDGEPHGISWLYGAVATCIDRCNIRSGSHKSLGWLLRSDDTLPVASAAPSDSSWKWLCSFDFIINCCRSVLNRFVHTIEVARYYRNWSYEVVGITSYQENAAAASDSVLPAISRWDLKKRIEKVESTVSDVKKFPLLDIANKSAPNDIVNMNRRKIRSSSCKREVFGREVLRDDIMAKLRETPHVDASNSSSSTCYSVIGIYGVAGSGKTTLARYVLDYIEKEYKDVLFDTIMCIHVSETFSVDDIFHDMLKDITNDRRSDISCREELEKMLKEILRGKRFFLVLDDVWVKNNNYQELKELLSPLNVGMKGSKILATARTKDAVRAVGADEPIAISILDEEQYFSMFMHYALDGTSVADENFVSVGREIAKKLRRSPIAAVTVAGRLGINRNISFWERTARLDVLNGTMGALWWSYLQLDVDIRRCFEFCNIFPRRFKLRRDELVHLWIAQGFVKTSCATEDMEDVAEGYVQELLSCSFLQPEGTGTFYFTIHDLLHDLADKVAGSDCFRIENGWSQRGEGWKGDVPRDVRHLFVQSYNGELITEKILELENLRTLIIYTVAKGTPVEEKVIESISKRLRKLRVLDIAFCQDNLEPRTFSVPESISQLKHLRYLAFRTGISCWIIWPSIPIKLYHMQLLDFGNCHEVVFPSADLIVFQHVSCRGPVMTARAMVSVSTGAMNSVLLKLAALLEDEHKPRVRNSIIALRFALTSMRSFLEKMSDKEDIDPLVEGWMKQVRDMTYDLEDCIDDYMRSAAPGDTNSTSTRVAQLLKMGKSRRQYASLLQQLKERVCEASDRRSRYEIVCDPGDQMELLGSPSMPSNVVPIDRRLPVFGAPPGDGLVGVDGPRDRLIKLLAPDSQQQLKMVSIVGSRGIGKTTLAMEVYRSLKGRFDCHTVISVSRRHDLRMILKSILSQVSAQEFDFTECDEGQLIDKLREFLETRRYFIIIEDIWDVSAWKIIRWAFPENGCGSRILVTTCIISIARSCCYLNEDHIVQMALLGDAEAKELFFRRIFHPEDCPPHLEDISDEILKKCGGLPLTILTIASLLAMKSQEKDEWTRVRDCIGTALDKSVTLEGMKQILYFAYFDLPFHLRTCLLYLNIFPENYVIDKARLIRRWIAEGFIIEELGKSSEEVGECYFNELINRGLIQPVGIQYNGRIEACQVHSIILDLIVSKSAEENFVIKYEGRGCNIGLQDKIRRLSLYCDYDQEGTFIPSAVTASHIRSLTIFMTNKEMPTLENFRALRVLDLESSGELEYANYLQNIGRLYLLKYLRLQTTRFIVLPEQVVELQFLQTLDLTRALIHRLPCSIDRLKQLNYLLVKNVKLPDGIEKLQVLQELSHVEIESNNSANSLEKLGHLTMLRVLGINWCISDTDTCMKICADSLVSSLNKLGTSNLQSLHIGSGSGCSLDFLLDSLSAPFHHLQEFRMTSDYHFPRIPEWMISLVSLTLLEINIDTVGEEVLKILGKLPSLLVLLLSVKSAALEQGLIIRSSGFQCLKQFDFICWNSWAMLMFEQGSMLALEKLQLKFLAKGACVHNGFQFGIEHIASLKYLHVDIGCKGAETREVEAAEEAIRSAVSSHPSHPRLELRRWWEEELIAAAVGWGMKAAGWIVSPIISELLRKGFSFLSIDISEKQKQLELKVVQLERMLRLQAVEIFPHRSRVELLLEDLKNAFYEAEDILDDVEYHCLEEQIEDDMSKSDSDAPSRKRDWVKKFATPSYPLKDQETGISKKMFKESLEKIEGIINNTCRFLERLNLPSVSNCNGSQAVGANSGNTVITATAPLKVIGRDEDRDKIIKMLHEKESGCRPNTNSDLCYSVIGIHGIGGSGKSTLAQYVYASEKEDMEEKKDGHFELVMWVHVSQSFSLSTIFSEMLEEATGKSCSEFKSLNALQENLKKELRGKRIFLILDDVWYNKHVGQHELQQILSLLVVVEQGSKILVTSRTTDAILAMRAVKCIPISELDDNDFLNLFMHYALEDTIIDDHVRRRLEVIGADIAKKLKGSPLAARTVGGRLRIRPKVEFWTTVKNQKLLDGTMGALWWSYQHLDEQARRCFAYCSIFPRRHHLYRDELVKLWVAEGFIRSPDEGEEMEDVGREYFDELASTSFLQPGGKGFGGKDYYLVHDLLHDLAETVAGGDCFRIENKRSRTGEGWKGDVPRDVRYLFVQSYDGELITEKILELENLRTLIIYTARDTPVEEKVIKSISKRLRKLRVLVIAFSQDEWDLIDEPKMLSVSESISQLKHLRYLAIRTSLFCRVILPSILTKLYHMQRIDAGYCNAEVFPSADLDYVRCLEGNFGYQAERTRNQLPDIGRLTSLHTMPFFNVRNEKGYEVKQLRDLNKLRGCLNIWGLGNVKSKEEALEANLAAKKRLTELALCWYAETSCSPDIVAEVLEGLCPPVGLEKLNILNYEGSRYPNWMVGKQNGGPKDLQELFFFQCSQLGPAPELDAFPHLRSLRLWFCSWDALPGNMEHLTSLKGLTIFYCLNIRSLPTLPPSLEEFTLSDCNDKFMKSCQTVGNPNWQKIEHIPTKKWTLFRFE